jgi:hypothetical protein
MHHDDKPDANDTARILRVSPEFKNQLEATAAAINRPAINLVKRLNNCDDLTQAIADSATNASISLPTAPLKDALDACQALAALNVILDHDPNTALANERLIKAILQLEELAKKSSINTLGNNSEIGARDNSIAHLLEAHSKDLAALARTAISYISPSLRVQYLDRVRAAFPSPDLP